MRVLFLLFFFSFHQAGAQLQERLALTDWDRCGFTNDFSLEGVPEFNFDQIKEELDPSLNDNEVLEHIFKEHRGGGIIFFYSGPYIFNDGIKLSSGFVLSGKHRDETKFIFDEMEKEQDLILAQGKKFGEPYRLSDGVGEGSNTVNIEENSGLNVNDWVLLSDNDEAFVHSDWARKKSGQICRIKKISKGEIEFDSPLRRDYLMENHPNITRLLPAMACGVSDITIINNQETENQSSNIQFRYAVNCFVAAISSQNSNYAHVLLEYAAHCTVQHSSFKNGQSYGDGGKAYGVVLQFATSDCLIMDNDFEHLRHSMLVQAGANGNLFTRNESKDPYWKEPFLPKHSAGDLVLHGNYPYCNLFTDNTFQQLVIDNSHGKSGPNNFFINNRIESYGIIMSRKQATDNCAFVNNTLGGKGMLKGKYRIKGDGHFESENLVKGRLRPKVK